jgi:hypothetical protein
MRLTIAAVPVVIGSFTLPLPDPGVVRHIAFEQRPTLVMTKGRPEFEDVPVLFIEMCPSATKRTRRFVVIEHGKVVDVGDDERAVWRGTGISGKGMVTHVFEIEDAPS